MRQRSGNRARILVPLPGVDSISRCPPASVVRSFIEINPMLERSAGTDFPPGGSSVEYAKALTEIGMFTEADLRAIDSENARKLLPRLAR